jgi:hypothetical protein
MLHSNLAAKPMTAVPDLLAYKPLRYGFGGKGLPLTEAAKNIQVTVTNDQLRYKKGTAALDPEQLKHSGLSSYPTIANSVPWPTPELLDQIKSRLERSSLQLDKPGAVWLITPFTASVTESADYVKARLLALTLMASLKQPSEKPKKAYRFKNSLLFQNLGNFTEDKLHIDLDSRLNALVYGPVQQKAHGWAFTGGRPLIADLQQYLQDKKLAPKQVVGDNSFPTSADFYLKPAHQKALYQHYTIPLTLPANRIAILLVNNDPLAYGVLHGADTFHFTRDNQPVAIPADKRLESPLKRYLYKVITPGDEMPGFTGNQRYYNAFRQTVKQWLARD